MAGIVKISSYKSWNNPSWHMNTNWLELCYSSVLSTKPFKNMNRVSPAEDTIWKQKKNTNIAGNSSFSFLQTMFLQLCKIYWTALADIWYILVVKLLWIVLIFMPFDLWFKRISYFIAMTRREIPVKMTENEWIYKPNAGYRFWWILIKPCTMLS